MKQKQRHEDKIKKQAIKKKKQEQEKKRKQEEKIRDQERKAREKEQNQKEKARTKRENNNGSFCKKRPGRYSFKPVFEFNYDYNDFSFNTGCQRVFAFF